MSNVRTDFASLIPPKDLCRLLEPPSLSLLKELSGLSEEEMQVMSEKDIEDVILQQNPIPPLDVKSLSSARLFGSTKAYCSYAKKELTSEADVRSKLQQKAEAKGVQLSSEHLDKLIAALKSTDPLPGDINVFLLFILETPKI